MDDIYTALEEARLLILVASSVDHINSPWVKSEWSTFLGSIRSGRKSDSTIITVLDKISTRVIPIQLEHFESFRFSDTDSTVNFVFKTLNRVKLSDAEAYLARKQELELKASRLAELAKVKHQLETELNASPASASSLARERRAHRTRSAGVRRQSFIEWLRSTFSERQLYGFTIALTAFLFTSLSFRIIDLNSSDRFVVQKNEPTEGIPHTIYNLRPDNNGYELVKLDTSLVEIIIPMSHEKKPITSIGDCALANCNTLTSVTIPDTVTKIGNYTFCWCDSLASMILPESITSIGDGAFYDCMTLSHVYLPDSVETIGSEAFFNCISLYYIDLPDDLVRIGSGAFKYCSELTEVTIPNSVKYIGADAFDINADHKLHITAPYEPSYYGYAPDPGVVWTIE